MKKFLVVYVSRTGKTKQMAEWIAEGLRMAGHTAVLKTLPQVKQVEDIAGYDGYVLGSPTYHKAMIEGFNSWLFKAQRAGVQGNLADTMEHVFKMDMAGLGPLRMEERVVVTDDGMHACQQFGRALGERAGA